MERRPRRRFWKLQVGSPRWLAASRSHAEVWREQLGTQGRRFLRGLGAHGITASRVVNDEGYLRARYLCLVRIEGDLVVPGPANVIQQILGAERTRYDVAISYAGEDRQLGRALYEGLHGRGIKVFFAEAETDWLWGQDLYQVLPNLYAQEAGTVLVLCTTHYCAKHWTRVEYDAVRTSHGDRIVLLSVDGKLPDDWPYGHVYLPGTSENLVRAVDLIALRVRGGIVEGP
ncbi:MAG: toll/interleukin-1 receptor domain-containing protein [Deltaproteobacteria bacterium]|nr:MAG: toll/interleukin-1 receptor domain-containing protein [Deltaproteobacteria bacterium]